MEAECPRSARHLWLPQVSGTTDGTDELEEWLANARLEGVLVQSEEVLATGRQLGDQAFSRFVASLLSASVEFARRPPLDGLHTGIRIQHIDLSGNCLTDTAAAALAECLAWIREHFGGHVLRSLHLSQNQIGPGGAEELALKFFPLDSSLVEYDLALSANPLGDVGVTLVARAVQRRNCNAVLHLSDVGCGAEGCRSLTDCLPALKGLDLSKNNIPGAELQALAAKLPATARFVLPEGLPASQTMVATQMTMERAVVPENRKAAAAANAVPRAQAVLDRARRALGKPSDATPAPAAPGARGAGHDTHSVSIASGLQATIDNQMFTRSRAPVVCLAPDGGMLQRQHSPSRVSATAQAVLDRARHVLQRQAATGVLPRTSSTAFRSGASVAPPQATMEAAPSPQLPEGNMAQNVTEFRTQVPLAAETKNSELPKHGALGTLGALSQEQPAELASATSRLASATAALQLQLGVERRPRQASEGERLVPDECEPDAEALAMPERTVRLEREVAELREDVRRIEHTVSSLQIEPEQEDRIEDNAELLWCEGLTSKIKPDCDMEEKMKQEKENNEGSIEEDDICSMPSIASLKAEKDLRESESLPSKRDLSPLKSETKPSKGPPKGKGKGPPLPSSSPKASPSRPKDEANPEPKEEAKLQDPSALQTPQVAGKGKGKAKGGPKGVPKGGPKGTGKGGPKGGPPTKGGGPGPPPKGGPPKGLGPGQGQGPAKAESKAPFHKKLYWKQVDIADAEGTIFSEESRRRANTCSAIDFNALSKILEAEKTKGSQLQRRSSGVLSKAQMRNIGTKVLSDHRARNIAIVLKRMPTSTTELVRVLSSLQWEDDRISSDDLEQILEAIPTQDEAKKLREHSSPEACQKLRDVEQMVMPLTLLNRASARVRVLCIARNVRLQFKSTMRSLARIRAACLAIQKSGMLRNVMLLALQLGNFINHGDSTKGAKAIAIGSLLALRDFKCGEGISTLHFLCASLMRSGQPDAAQVLQRELQPAERIAKMQVQGLSAGMKAFERDLDSIKSECRNYLEEYEGGGDDAVEPALDDDAKEFGQELAEVQAAAAAAACDMLESPRRRQKEDEDATRWVEDVMKIRGSAQRRLRCMRCIIEKLCSLLKADMESTAEQVHATLRFCGVLLPKSSNEVPVDLEALLSNLSEFTKVFKEHWDEVKKNMSRYQQLFSDGESASSSGAQ
ncbi:unnamed protein product [Durusdinium trenchii]|uniref:FH2 domain-containing protein n=1 Tax=Durusdinium trenchii TaxID=1381693 RepID=A0ABP0MPD2_9DINO